MCAVRTTLSHSPLMGVPAVGQGGARKQMETAKTRRSSDPQKHRPATKGRLKACSKYTSTTREIEGERNPGASKTNKFEKSATARLAEGSLNEAQRKHITRLRMYAHRQFRRTSYRPQFCAWRQRGQLQPRIHQSTCCIPPTRPRLKYINKKKCRETKICRPFFVFSGSGVCAMQRIEPG